ncbi:substrate-binding domain-containing protein [Dyella choica]|nr:substrate-binding domain-containing protein [Dyella choica]
MSNGLNRLNTRTKLIAGALALVMAGVSHAGTQVGGGATLPSLLYVGSAAANPSTPQLTDASVTNPPSYVGAIASGSLLGVYDSTNGTTSSYCLTGSGSGKNILAGITNNSVQDVCPTSGTSPVLHGFGAPVVSRTDLTQPNFAAADAPLSQADFSNYTGNHGGSLPVQFPVVVGAVAIAFNLTDSTGAQVTSSEVNFSDLQVCQIFSGQITNWSDSRLANAFTLTAGVTIPSSAINVQYRKDGSGTSFSFSNHLSAVCAAAGLSGGPFEANQAFVGASPAVTSNFFTTAPSGWTGSSGNAGVAAAIGSTASSIGYVELANAQATNPGLQFGSVNGKSPVSNFSVSSITGSSIAFNQVISSTNNTNGTPALTAISPAPTTQCIAIVRPNKYAAPSSTLGSIVPVGSYPIVAVSYFLGNSTGNGSDQATTQGLVTSPYNSAITSHVTAVGGLQFIGLGSNSFTSSQVSGCYGL